MNGPDLAVYDRGMSLRRLWEIACAIGLAVTGVIVADAALWSRTPADLPPEDEVASVLAEALDFDFELRGNGVSGRFGDDDEPGWDPVVAGAYAIRPVATPYESVAPSTVEQLRASGWAVDGSAESGVVLARRGAWHVSFGAELLFTRAAPPARSWFLFVVGLLSFGAGLMLRLGRRVHLASSGERLFSVGISVLAMFGAVSILTAMTSPYWHLTPTWILFTVPVFTMVWILPAAAVVIGTAQLWKGAGSSPIDRADGRPARDRRVVTLDTPQRRG